MTDYASFVRSVESPTGADNTAGSGAFSHYQFMPATAAALAGRTAWGRGMSPAQVKLALADPKTGRARSDELFNLYTGDSKNALRKLGLPIDHTSLLAMHRFGQGGGGSLLNAPGNMPVEAWVKSVNWGPGIAPAAVIKQNNLGRFATVNDLRTKFLGGAPAPAPEPSVADWFAPPADAPAPQAPAPQPFAPLPMPPPIDLAALFQPDERSVKRDQDLAARRRKLFW